MEQLDFMWFTRSVLFLLLLSLSATSVCQNTFSFRTWSTFNSQYAAVHEIGGAYYVLGPRVISGQSPFYQFTLSRFNLDGEIQELNGFGSEEMFLLMRFDATDLKDAETIVMADDGFVDGQNFMILNWVSITGELIGQEFFSSPFVVEDPEAEDIIFPWDIKIAANGDIYTVSGVSPGNGTGFYTYLIKHNSAGDILWSQMFEGLSTSAKSINIMDGQILITYGEVNLENDELIDKWILIVDEDDGGVQSWVSYDTGIFVCHVEESVYSDGLITMVTGLSFDATNSLVPVIYQVDWLGNLQWLTYLDVAPVNNREQYYRNIVQTLDDGFVAGGMLYILDPENAEQNGPYNRDVVMTKYSQYGEELWSRRFNHVSSLQDEHLLIDLIQTSDGGYLFCGQAADWANETPELIAYQQGWLVKTDEHGCLVPGCHVSVEEFEEENGYFKIGPNPASSQGYLNVFYSEVEHLDQPVLTITNALGQVVETVAMRNHAMTYLIDLSGYAAGNYQVQLSDVSGVRQVEKLVVW